jgi:hypothetical protein
MREGVEDVPAAQGVEADAAAREAQLRADADLYAINYPRRAQAIRRARGLPEGCDFGPPEPALVRAIVRGDSENLRAADALLAV